MAIAAGTSGLSTQTVQAIHAYLAAAPSALMTVQLEDVLGFVEQANMPSTVTEQPNWQRKLPIDLQALRELAAATAAALAAAPQRRPDYSDFVALLRAPLQG